MAIGSPFTLSNTITAGIISNVGREETELGLGGGRMKYIQTDAAVNSGNSGGPLINMDGEVIGITTLTVLGTSGISFAIPIDKANVIIQKLLQDGRVVRPYLGIEMVTLKPTIINILRTDPKRSSEQLPSTGVLVRKVDKSSPAYVSGIRPHDIIVEFDGKAIKSSDEVIDLVGDEVGKKIKLRALRMEDGKIVKKDFTIVTEILKDDQV